MQATEHSAQDVLTALRTAAGGLTSEEAAERLEKYGENRLREEKKASLWKLLAEQFNSVLVWLLLFAVAVSVFLGDMLESTVIGFILLVNAAIGFLQEYRAEKALDALKKISGLQAKVLRDGSIAKVDTRVLVPGDIVMLETGDRVPADARLVEAMNLETQEAMLTGESAPVLKSLQALPAGTPLAERSNMVFSGTLVTKGHASAVVTGTGMETELGKIASLLSGEEERKSPLQKKLNHFSRRLAFVVVAAAAVIFFLTWTSGEDLLETFKTAISLAVAAIPEGLPAVVALTLARGVQRMVSNNAIVRHLPAIETLGSSSVICSDKTGTMTMNRMSVRKVYANGRVILLDEERSAAASDAEELGLLFRIGALCNDAVADAGGGIFGDPTEAALLQSAKRGGQDPEMLRNQYPRRDDIGFDSERKMMSTLHEGPEEGMVMFTKGAPDVLLGHCSRIMAGGEAVPLSDDMRRDILDANDAFASDALRVLGFAWKPVGEKAEFAERDLVFAGLQAMNDPPRPEVVEAVARCRDAGIKVVMITGDQKATAEAIGRELGITGRAMTGSELESENELSSLVEEVSIFARVSPEQKIRIVEALQENEHVVAMTGDGVNDAPALKQADIGVAMGKGGTDVAREASTMVLTDDNFASIVRAVEEGRAIFENLRKFVYFLLSSNISEVLIIVLAVLAGLKLPLVAIQILWVNLITDGLPALALGFEPKGRDVMQRPPIAKSAFIVNTPMILRLAVASLVITGGALGLYLHSLFSAGWGWGQPLDGDGAAYMHATTMAFTALVVYEMINAFLARSESENIFTLGVLANPWLAGAVAVSLFLHLLVIYSPLNQAFHSVPLSPVDWALVFGASTALIAADAVFKAVVGPDRHNRGGLV
ncbi:calcium-translocating P-type ATPase, SERCA-type [Prosthecochloris sp. GSB1]|uniref:calcium-translocating P-type ATPase, SERCA-type n=1 Tax=Prosthecochloris sp. GSB1 TaxID=281093 RepID=UPI000B8CA807|nr:calcium-translocating P-type ATPase, SERCA-type [Prosthecochloris sp. GSB1]ASQ89694.1 calcium-translocating P-type ATPase, SERCA-type [Prosthecochloris sp. GSB1]